MFSAAYRILNDKSKAEDAVQDAFLKVIKYPNKVLSIPIEDLKPYLIVVSENSARNIYKREKSIKEEPLEEDTVSQEDNLENLTSSRIDIERIFCVPQVNVAYRDVLLLRYYYNFSTREISIALGISENNVRIRIMRARTEAHKLFQEEDS